MTKDSIPDDLRRFILTSIPSVPFLEAVLLLQAQPELAWTVPELARRLYVPEPRITEILDGVQAAGIAAKDDAAGGYRYAPPLALSEMLGRLARVYSTDLVAVTDLIHSRTDKRAFQFADAFRLRKD